MTIYQDEWARQKAREDVPPKHLPVHRWYLQIDDPASLAAPAPPRDGLTIMRAEQPTIPFYRFLYHTAGEDYLWGDRRRMSDADLQEKISPDHIHVCVLYDRGTPAGFFEMGFRDPAVSHLKYFALLPGFTGGGLGSFLLNSAIRYAADRASAPLKVDTCTLDHEVALENYLKRGFVIVREEDEIYADPRLDGTVRPDAAPQIPPAR